MERLFRFSDNQTTVRTELLAGVTKFLTMACIIVVQPAVLSGKMFGTATGLEFGAVTTATCISAALATAIMALYARYPRRHLEWVKISSLFSDRVIFQPVDRDDRRVSAYHFARANDRRCDDDAKRDEDSMG